MRRPRLALIVTLVALAACTGGGSAPTSVARNPSDRSFPGLMPPPTGTYGDGVTVVQPRPGMANVHAVRWEGARIAADDVTLSVRFLGGVEPCFVLDHVTVDYRPDVVILTLFAGSDPAAGDVACPAIGVPMRVAVTLDEPLAGRALLDGARKTS